MPATARPSGATSPQTTGWQHTDKNPWGTAYKYDDAGFQKAITWWKGLIDKGYMPPLEQTVGASMNDNFGAGKSAINANGSWMIGSYTGYEGLELGIAPTPVGPSGKRASMFNGLADSIFAGTDNKEAAGKWVAFLGSEECQKIVGQAGVVFPAIPAAGRGGQEGLRDQGRRRHRRSPSRSTTAPRSCSRSPTTPPTSTPSWRPPWMP